MIVESETEKAHRLELIKEEAESKIKIEKDKQVIAGLLNKSLSNQCGTLSHGGHAHTHQEVGEGDGA